MATRLGYRQLLKVLVEEKNLTGEAMSFSKLASLAKIQRSYLSQVVNLKHHLSNDQLYAICEVLQLSKDVRQHLMLLSEWERCKLDPRKMDLERKLAAIEEKDQGKIFSEAEFKQDALDDYFCDPLGEVALKFLSIESFRKNPAMIQQRLGLSSSRWQEILRTLEESGFIICQNQAIRVLKSAVFPAEESAAEKIRNIQGRLKVVHQKLKQRNIDEFLYNWWFIANPNRKRQLKIEYLQLLQSIYQDSLRVPHKDVYQLSIDLLSP